VGYPKNYGADEIPPAVVQWVDLILPTLIEGDHPVHSALREQYQHALIREVKFTRVGCFIEFEVPPEVPLTEPADITGGNAIITFEGGSHGAGSILFVRDGRLDTLEIYTYVDKWPVDAVILDVNGAWDIETSIAIQQHIRKRQSICSKLESWRARFLRFFRRKL
jgi:hypothetical protein